MSKTVPWDAIPEAESITVTDAGVHVRDLFVARKDVADYLYVIPRDERLPAFIHAVEVGVFCLERARSGADTEFVKRQIESLLVQVAQVPDVVQKHLVNQIGTGDGQVLAPVKALINTVSQATDGRIKEVKELLSQDIDPSKDSSTLGAALKAIRSLVDPDRNDSVQATFTRSVAELTTQDGALAKAVKAVVTECVSQLKEEVDQLAKEIRGRDAAADVIARTTEKGAPYEDELVARLQQWARMVGAEVHHVGRDNRPGDVLLVVPPVLAESDHEAPLRVVLEARDRDSQPLGRRQLSETLAKAMAERGAGAAIYVSRSPDGFAKEIGDWAEGACDRGRFIATTEHNVLTAVRFLVAQHRLSLIRAANREVNIVGVEAQLARIRTALGRVININGKVTKGRDALTEIQAEADGLRNEIRGALVSIEDALRLSGTSSA